MREPTPRQIEVLRFIAAETTEHGVPPGLRDIAGRFGFGKNASRDHIVALERKGMLRRGGFKCARAITLLDAAAPYVADLAPTHPPIVSVILPTRCVACGTETFDQDRPCFGCAMARKAS